MEFKLVCANILHGGRFMDNLLDFLDHENADILVLQEAVEAEKEVHDRKYHNLGLFRDKFKYIYFSPEFFIQLNGVRANEGNLICSKFRITKSETFFFDVPYGATDLDLDNPNLNFSALPRNVQVAKIQIGGQTINLLNTHGIWGYDGNDNERRFKMIDEIIDLIKDKDNVILCGDFNFNEDTKAIGNLEKHVVNIFKGERKTSFNMKRKDKPGYASAIVDFIFVSPNLKIKKHYIPDVDVSDHLPLVAVIEA